MHWSPTILQLSTAMVKALLCAGTIATMALIALWSWPTEKTALTFVPILRQPLEHKVPTPVYPGVPAIDRTELEDSSSAKLAVGAVALVAVAIAGQAARQQSSRIPMRSRGKNFLRPNAKGTKPLIHWQIARDFIKDAAPGIQKKFRKASEMEDFVKKNVAGKMQFQWASNQFWDEEPLVPIDGNTGARRETIDHHMDEIVYVRKFLKPASFKKLEIKNWEMPENYTKAVSLKELVDAGVQYGHASGVWNPKMLKYLYADFDGTHIFDMVQTAACLNRACYYVFEAASKGATFMFTGTKAQAAGPIKKAAERTDSWYTDIRWAGGILTNHWKIREAIALMQKMQAEKDQGAFKLLSPDDREKAESKLVRLTRKYHGIQDMTGVPDIMIVIDEMKERNPIAECVRLGIPIVGLIDSNNNPDWIDLPVPGNASGVKSIDLVLGKLTEAILKGKELYEQTQLGDREVVQPEWDPWMFSMDRIRWIRRRSKRQAWHKTLYGGYEQYKIAYPFGRIPKVAPFDKNFTWPMKV